MKRLLSLTWSMELKEYIESRSWNTLRKCETQAFISYPSDNRRKTVQSHSSLRSQLAKFWTIQYSGFICVDLHKVLVGLHNIVTYKLHLHL